MKSLFEELLNNKISMEDVVSKLLELHGEEKASGPIVRFANAHSDEEFVFQLVNTFNEEVCNGDFAIYSCRHCGRYGAFTEDVDNIAMRTCLDCYEEFCTKCVPLSEEDMKNEDKLRCLNCK